MVSSSCRKTVVKATWRFDSQLNHEPVKILIHDDSKIALHFGQRHSRRADYVYTLERHHLRAKLPQRVDLRPGCPRVVNQGHIGTCTAHAVAAAVACEGRLQEKRPQTPSRLFIFYNERRLTGQRSLNCVVRLRDAIKAVAKHGVCPKSHWPYRQHPTALRKRAPKEAFKAARNCRIIEYHRIPERSLPHFQRFFGTTHDRVTHVIDQPFRSML